ncbi:hypothetical protein HB847_15040 [Listeria booriae]|uniref:Lipoprotein n=1 Tax=Listeria booriae TaxID=1552123 RepID=A0A841Y9T2_9LIST|nr:hypothetical protein [Listeria booriae]MBC1373667.1 hypothetical protein [Listeria booriae]
MSKKMIIVGMLCFVCFISACSNKPETIPNSEEDKKVVETPIKDFSRIDKLVQSTEPQDIDRIVKVLFYESNNMQYKNTIAIDIGNNVMYLNPKVPTLGLVNADYKMTEDDVEKVQNIIKKYGIQSWKEDYSDSKNTNYEDGYGWVIYLEYADRTVERHSGSGMYRADVIPKNFDTFIEEITNFVDNKKDDLNE